MKKRILSIVIGIALFIGTYGLGANNMPNNETADLRLSVYDTSGLRNVGDPGEGLPK